jgi:hypothetical protein
MLGSGFLMSLTDIGWIIVVWTALAVLVYLPIDVRFDDVSSWRHSKCSGKQEK